LIVESRPNIIYFLVDDMGYGDVSCLNPQGKIATPNFDRLAREGMVFTDCHSTSSVCSPSRYSILTGRYNWRSSLQQGIVGQYGKPLIDRNRLTVPKLLRDYGYHTACLGKWHLGMGWDFEATEDFLPKNFAGPAGSHLADPCEEPSERQRDLWKTAFAKPVHGGPIAAGFDYYFGVDVPNWPPYCFIENDRTVGVPSEWLKPWLLEKNMASVMGPAMPYWNFEQLLPTFAAKADRYIKERAGEDRPFFLYMPMTSPHTPLAVNKPWIGKSGLNNLYADFVMETDDVFGNLLESLERHGVADNTLVIFTSDNGCAHYIGINELEEQGHYPSAHFRGAKSDAWDGGHRIPFIVRWPQVIRAGSRCDQLVSLADLMATCASIVGRPLPDQAGEDSFNLLPVFKETSEIVREHAVQHSIQGKFAIRDRHWKLVLCPGSGGWSKSDAEAAREGFPLVQLYNLQEDPGETNNVYAEYPERVRAMIGLLKKLVAEGRSTPGISQSNDAPVDIWKLDSMPGVNATMLEDY
jgi:arylsulfatase A-like enzyme